MAKQTDQQPPTVRAVETSPMDRSPSRPTTNSSNAEPPNGGFRFSMFYSFLGFSKGYNASLCRCTILDPALLATDRASHRSGRRPVSLLSGPNLSPRHRGHPFQKTSAWRMVLVQTGPLPGRYRPPSQLRHSSRHSRGVAVRPSHPAPCDTLPQD